MARLQSRHSLYPTPRNPIRRTSGDSPFRIGATDEPTGNPSSDSGQAFRLRLFEMIRLPNTFKSASIRFRPTAAQTTIRRHFSIPWLIEDDLPLHGGANGATAPLRELASVHLSCLRSRSRRRLSARTYHRGHLGDTRYRFLTRCQILVSIWPGAYLLNIFKRWLKTSR